MTVQAHEHVASSAPQEEGVEVSAEEFVHLAFNEFMDSLVESLVLIDGVDSDTALDGMFAAIELFEEEGHLPPFPEGADAHEKGIWLLAAKDTDFFTFVQEAVLGG